MDAISTKVENGMEITELNKTTRITTFKNFKIIESFGDETGIFFRFPISKLGFVSPIYFIRNYRDLYLYSIDKKKNNVRKISSHWYEKDGIRKEVAKIYYCNRRRPSIITKKGSDYHYTSTRFIINFLKDICTHTSGDIVIDTKTNSACCGFCGKAFQINEKKG